MQGADLEGGLMIVCDMCPDRTPATMRFLFETIDPEQPAIQSDDPFGLMALAGSMGLLSRANVRSAVSLCQEHTRTLSRNPDVARAMLEDALKANRENER